MQVGEQDDVEIRHRGSGFAEAQRRAAADVHQQARPALDPYEITAGSAPVLQLRTARAQHLDLNRRGGATGLRRRGREPGEAEQAQSEAPNHAGPTRWMRSRRMLRVSPVTP